MVRVCGRLSKNESAVSMARDEDWYRWSSHGGVRMIEPGNWTRDALSKVCLISGRVSSNNFANVFFMNFLFPELRNWEFRKLEKFGSVVGC